MKLLCTLLLMSMISIHGAYGKKMAPKELTIQTQNSSINWVGSKKLGDKHTGQVPIKSGKILFDGTTFTGGEVEIDLTQLEVTDIPKTDKNNQKLTNHLKSDDFFSVERFPVAKFVIKNAKKISDQEYEFTGDLTIKDVTKPHTVRAQVTMTDNETQATGTIKIDRTVFGVKYGSANFFKLAADRIINDEFELTFKLVAK